MKGKQTVASRLTAYAMLYKLRIAAALLVLCCAVGAELAGPFIAKTIIDKHISSVQLPWYEASADKQPPTGMKSIGIAGKTYVRSDWISSQSAGDKASLIAGWKEVRFMQLEGGMYLIDSTPQFEGNWSLSTDNTTTGQRAAEGNQATVMVKRNATTTELFPAKRLSVVEAGALYQYEVGAIIQWLGLFIALLLAASVLHYLQAYTLQSTALRIIQRMRMDLMRHIQRIPIRFFDSTPIGQVVSRIANDTEAIRDLFMSFMATFVVSSINILGIYVALFLLDVRLALVTLVFIPLFAAVMWVHLKFSKKYITIMRARLSDMNAMISESIAVMPILQAFRQEKARLSEFEVLNNDRYRSNVKQFRVFSLSSRNFSGLIGSLFTAGTIWYFGGQSLQTAISFGVFYAFIDYSGRFFQPIIGIFDQLMNAQRAVVSAEKVFYLLDLEGQELEDAVGIARLEGHVAFDNVTFAYKEGEPVLRGISFEANKGETIALVGHTGSGKSSIMNLLLGFYEPSNGEIRIDGRSIAGKSKQALRKHMGIVLQDPFLFAGDIKFNVSLYNKEIDESKIKQALTDVGASSFIEKLPGGYDEPVVERGSTLSAGQRQLISFARALAFDPAILILDEATASIDSETEGLIQQALKVVSKGRTTFIIAHRLSTIRDADLILVLNRGEIVERGSHNQLMEKQGRYYQMYQLQKGGESQFAKPTV
ncbi:ABC transporter ATP-binding protein [Paenibacillus radicis (ex Xue et al. 2023)]|uniref:ABC transporter ATP-binding protein/permease n=1 Tax=Paenibacillus radicis (ex Xue et al. 2023) TaxID=2972489 RepID=A0ABT1YKX4_9BACL|nr:ABC transporter ATP-binding protein [Paenibacillus radicis (ex Xue et al. 2023)]MCR8633850.1 ABC transporter ATP-binding protein/permease [Paenibacillus radicis (ex Xue et al. 2023)]